MISNHEKIVSLFPYLGVVANFSAFFVPVLFWTSNDEDMVIFLLVQKGHNNKRNQEPRKGE